MRQNFKIDLHTHSSISYDGGITVEQYRSLLTSDTSLVIAITDHNQISLAQQLNKEFTERVIVGSEILTEQGEIIGLFLQNNIMPNQSALETCQQIKEQGGLVYIPHPLEKTRKGLSIQSLHNISSTIDIIETFNARTREPWLAKQIEAFALENNIVMAASSDAHGIKGFSTSYSIINNLPTRDNVVQLLISGELVKQRPSLISFLDPFINKIKNLFS